MPLVKKQFVDKAELLVILSNEKLCNVWPDPLRSAHNSN